jgi:N-acetylmuramoyl-L-alanine amidase
MREQTTYIVIHCSQTRPSQKEVDVRTIDKWHRLRGWLKIGYGGVIKRDGTYEQGRDDNAVQAHVKGYNHTSFGLCVVGGANEEDWKLPEDNFTAEQWETLKAQLTRLVELYPNARIVGHYDLDKNKTCPNFDVQNYLLHEDIPNYKFQDALTNDADLAELQSNEEPS